MFFPFAKSFSKHELKWYLDSLMIFFSTAINNISIGTYLLTLNRGTDDAARGILRKNLGVVVSRGYRVTV